MKQLRLILFLSLSILFAHEGDHQHTHKGKRGATGCIIYGTVIDSVTNLPIEYASISIINSEGEVITGGVSDELGDFKVKEIKPGSYDVKIEFMGFTSRMFNDIQLSFELFLYI